MEDISILSLRAFLESIFGKEICLRPDILRDDADFHDFLDYTYGSLESKKFDISTTQAGITVHSDSDDTLRQLIPAISARLKKKPTLIFNENKQSVAEWIDCEKEQEKIAEIKEDKKTSKRITNLKIHPAVKEHWLDDKYRINLENHMESLKNPQHHPDSTIEPNIDHIPVDVTMTVGFGGMMGFQMRIKPKYKL